jgi:predicted transcriptional regulator
MRKTSLRLVPLRRQNQDLRSSGLSSMIIRNKSRFLSRSTRNKIQKLAEMTMILKVKTKPPLMRYAYIFDFL